MEDTQKRFIELADRADERFYTTFTDFLNMEEQSVLKNTKLSTPYHLFGGYEMAERCVAGFGENSKYDEFPISIIKIEPLQQKFADKLSHRDFLGSLMGLGIKRELLGDIVIAENIGFLFCIESIANYIVQNLDKVKHTSVKCKIVDELPKTAIKEPDEVKITVSSLRLDVVVAGVYNFSRNEVKEHFVARKIFVNSKLTENFSQIVKSGDVISVRGFGRFVYCDTLGTTKKNRLIISVKVYR